MNLWSPTHVQFTVLRARNLIAKGKGGNNDVFVTIQLGKEKYQTSTIKNALNPEWFEECDLSIPHTRSEIEVSLFHRGLLSDDFLGYASIPIWEHKVTETSKSSWVSLHNKPSKPEDKYRGEIEVKLTFHSQSRSDTLPHGLKKRSPSIRSLTSGLTSALGDKLKFTRSRSFRDSRRDSELGNMEKSQNFVGSSPGIPGDGQENALTRSYSMSAAYIKSMSQERSKPVNVSSGSNLANITNNSNFVSDVVSQGVTDIYTQSLHNIPGSRRSCSEVPFHQLPPPPYDIRLASRDDSFMTFPREGHQINSAHRIPVPLSGIYESIKERTEPENSISSSSDPESVPMPKPRGKKLLKKGLLATGSNNRDCVKESVGLSLTGKGNSLDQQPFNGRDSGILDDRSSSLGNSLEGSIATTDGANSGSKARAQAGVADMVADYTRLDHPVGTAGGLLYHLDREMSLNGSARSKKKMSVPSQFYSKENSLGELVVRKRSRGQRDRERERLRQIRQGTGTRRGHSKETDTGASGLYDDSTSEHSDSSRADVPDDLLSVFKTMSKEELLRVVITSKAQMIRKDQYIRDLENYIDDLLVRVMETTPRLLTRQQFHRM